MAEDVIAFIQLLTGELRYYRATSSQTVLPSFRSVEKFQTKFCLSGLDIEESGQAINQ